MIFASNNERNPMVLKAWPPEAGITALVGRGKRKGRIA